jgi:CheY-like chemotaxis protein
VDEDVIASGPLRIELEVRGIEVLHFETADACIEQLKSRKEIDLFIIDVMLAAEIDSTQFTPQKTNDFLVTGLHVATEVRSRRPYVPIILFSAASSTELVKTIETVASRLDHTAYWRKHDFTSANDFANKLENVLKNGISERHGLLKKLWSSVVLKPTVAGMGVDVKKLIE